MDHILKMYLFSFVVLILVVPPIFSRTTNLFGAGPSGGIWGVSLDSQTDGTVEDLPRAGYPSVLMGTVASTASYDSMSGQVLMELAGSRKLVYGPICATASEEPKYLTNVSTIPLNDPQYGDCVNCEASAFALYDSKIYFLMYGEFFNPNGGITRLVQVRMLKSCDDCPEVTSVHQGKYDLVTIVKCSKVIANVIHKEFTFATIDEMEYRGGKHMKVVELDGELSFFFQLGNISRPDGMEDEVMITLYHVTAGGVVTALHHEKISKQYSEWNLHALGSVDYNDGSICWTTADKLFCGDFTDESTIENSKMVLFPGEGASNGVCLGDRHDVLTILTGVTIVEHGDTRTVVFSCYPQEPETGGTGLMRVSRDGRQKQVYALSTETDRLLSGSVFYVDSLADTCSFEPKPDICEGNIMVTTAVSTESEEITEKMGGEDSTAEPEGEGDSIETPDKEPDSPTPPSSAERTLLSLLGLCYSCLITLLITIS